MEKGVERRQMSSSSSTSTNPMNHEETRHMGNKSKSTMTRLVDYFVVVGYTTDPKKGGTGCGVTLQRFPSKDWDDTPFNPAIELFCQPQGWSLSNIRQEPKFFMSVLTDVDASRRYCACLSFHEPISVSPSKPADEEEENEESNDSLIPASYGSPSSRSSSVFHTMYAPKVLVLMSRHYQPEAFRHCLGTIYTVHTESLDIPLETLVGNLLGHVHLPPSAGPAIRFSIGGGDRQALQPPLTNTIPVTNCCVAQLFQQLGISNIIVLFCAVMTEQKILFHSKSRTRLTDACHALTSLMFPFRYCHVYIPLLPSSITEVASSPTPYIIGILSEARYSLPEMVDVIIADLDGGAINVPEGVSIPVLPESLWHTVQDQLSMVLHPELTSADFAFPPLVVKSSSLIQLDKEIRAIFMRMLAQMFQGYRTCLVIIRIHPKPFITFHKAKFLGERGLTECEFVIRLLNCMFFNEFISERGSPFRPNDLWDDLYCSLLDQLKAEIQDPKMAMIFILELATLLGQNENPNSQTYVPKIVKPPEGAHTRTHVPILPTLNDAVIQDIINEGMAKQALSRFNNISKHNQPRIVPMGPKITELLVQQRQMVDNSARRLEVLRNCINYIFENKISDARKSIHAVIRALKSHTAKLVLCQELGHHVSGNKAMLEAAQFDMVVKLMHYALQGNSIMDEHGIAAALLPLATSFCRKLCTGVIQFAFTSIQDHPVWKNQQFWETAFYSDVQKDIKSLYIPASGNYAFNNNYPVISNFERGKELPPSGFRQTEFTALEIAAEQMRLVPTLDPEKTKELINSEESTLYSQAIHYAYRMVYMLVPLDTPAKRHREPHHHHHHHHHHGDDERSSNVISVTESDSLGGESGFEEQDPLIADTGTSVVRFVSRFVDKVCTEGGVTEDHIRALHAMIPGVVDMHVETLEAVFRESKRLPAVQKPKIPTPPLLLGEELVMESLRVYLLPDGRDINAGSITGTVFLPAEGAIFFTNYRLIFKGTPCDPMASEYTVIRSFPIASLTKEKRITVQYLAHLDQLLQDGLQLRSATFQLMKLAFDEEVSNESVDVLRKLLNKLRHPTDIFSYFSFAGHPIVTPAPLNAHKDKNQTLKGFAKKAVMMTAKKAGLKPKPSKRQKYVLRNWTHGNGGTLPANTKYMGSPNKSPPSKDNDGDDVSQGSFESSIREEQYVSDEDSPHGLQGSHVSNQANDAKSMERIMERAYYKDYRRLGLNSPARRPGDSSAASILSKIDSFRISSINISYMVCRSYPALVVVPALTTDETLKRISKCYKGGRFPVITWRHPRTKGLIVRGSSFNSKGVMGILRGQGGSGGSGGDAGTHLEQENFLRAIVNATPLTVVRPDSAWALSGSNLSLDSLLTTTGSVTSGAAHESHSHLMPTQGTPDSGRRLSGNPFIKAMDTLRYAGTSGGKGMKNYKQWTAVRPKKPIPIPPQGSNVFKVPTINEVDVAPHENPPRPQKAALYVFGEKSQIKGIKTDTHSKIEYIPVDVTEVRQTRASFKKLMRACLPSNTVTDSEKSFFSTVESTDWLQQISHLMQLAGAVVDLVDVQGSSVMLCLEDGSDVTTQITSLAQLCLDPYYRTLDGFHTLLEKEWLGFGHRFSHRNSMTGIEGPSSNPGFAPLFLQFLDIVHQIHKQFPLAFEFNQYYIQFLAFHSVSARFRTFLVDNEYERVELGFMAIDDKRGSLPRHYKGVDTGSDDDSIYMTNKGCSNSHQHHLGQSLFEYIEKLHAKIPIFFNFSYDKDCEIKILRPMSSLANLDLWEYYTCETLRAGASYDLEVIPSDHHADEEQSSDLQKDPRRAVFQGFDIVDNHVPDAFRHQLSEINKFEVEMGLLPQKWKQIFDKLEATAAQDDHTLTRQTSMSTQMVRNLGRSLHKKSTVDILIRGKMVRSTDLSSMYTHNHRFEKHTFTTLANCDVCSAILLGKTGVRCCECAAKCHEKCVDGVAKCQGKFGKAPPPESVHSSNTPKSTTSSQAIATNKSASSLAVQSSPPNYYDQFHSNIAENRTHEGYLYKRGALLKGWKQRWFVLDSIKHQLRYYDAMEDSHSKGFIDLSEVINITLAAPTPGSPKKACDKSFFDIRTVRRSYNFCANDAALAQEWIEKIQACL